MKLLDVALNAVILLSATVFLSYIGVYYFDFGLFTALPESITEFFLSAGALQYVALALVVAALIAKALVGRAIARQETRRQI
ncbi:hypothetical protein CLV46_1010 [Diaminobutyricimonas aerilata]|uniref:Uncharacterized protein n=2 Tax=Diaminobutyricimonas aerilata TaxID=1162967 RepID=A0A2M9CHW0_9MICO|nr:hypothetical protein CLV46_1010 [Diaminobutyricimonas aerilata]